MDVYRIVQHGGVNSSDDYSPVRLESDDIESRLHAHSLKGCSRHSAFVIFQTIRDAIGGRDVRGRA